MPRERDAKGTMEGFPAHEACLANLIARYAQQQDPQRVALLAPGRQPLTYGRLWDQLNTVTTHLQAWGITPADRVALVLPNGPEMAVAFLAVASTAACAPLNPAYRAQEFEFFFEDLDAKALVIQAGMESPAIQVAQARDLPIIALHPVQTGEAGVFALTGEPPATKLLSRRNHSQDIALLLHTSGTTAKPKLVPLTHANLLASAANIVATLQLSAEDRCLNIMPLFHIHGLIGALVSSLAAGGSMVCTPGFEGSHFFDWVDAFSPTWHTAVPTMHQSLLAQAHDHPDRMPPSSFRFIRSSSAPLPPAVMEDLERTFQCPVIEAYGMTEAAHQMASNPLPPASRKPGSVGRAAGPEVAIVNEQGKRLPRGETGEVAIRGPNVMRGYENNPVANAASYTDGWFRTGDQGYVDHEGYLYLTGRLKEMINRGGEKIAPREVDEVLLNHPAVAQAVTFALPHDTLGEEVAAAVVLKVSGATTVRELQKFVAARLAEFKVPRRIVVVEDIPKGPTGKLQRMGLAGQLGLTTESRPSPSEPENDGAPRTEIEESLTTIWCEILKVPTVGVNQSFFDVGGDSIRAAQIVFRVQALLPVSTNIDAVTIFQKPTVAELSQEILASMDPADRIRVAEFLAQAGSTHEQGTRDLVPETR